MQDCLGLLTTGPRTFFNSILRIFPSWNVRVDPRHSFAIGVNDKEAPVQNVFMMIWEDHVFSWSDLFIYYILVFLRVRFLMS